MIWIFDLDNTLFNATKHVYPWMKAAMECYIQEHLGLSAQEAQALRNLYRRQYGSTMTGLLRHHAIDPHDFVRSIHPFTELPGMVPGNAHLKAVLAALPGEKFVYTNAARFYAQEVLRLLGVSAHFQGLFTIEDAGFAAKPDRNAFKKMLKRFAVTKESAVFVEDQARNLETAKAFGVKTVLVHPAPTPYRFVDIRLRSLKALPGLHKRLAVREP
jgi:putative hydrolase of the HAD superfamily